MNKYSHKQYRLSLSSGLNKLTAFIFSIFYGLFIVAMLRLQYKVGSGDIGSYIYFFDQFNTNADAPQISLRADGAFRLAIFFLKDFFNIDVLIILSIFAFIISSIVSYIFLLNIKSQKSLVYLLPLILMIFTTPIVQALFSSYIRSGIAFSILMIGIIYFRGIFQLFLFALSSIIHFSMIPFVGFYVLFRMIKRIKYNEIKLNNTFTLLLLICSSVVVAIVGGIFQEINPINSSFAYNLLIFYISLFIILTSRRSIRNIFGFLSMGMVFVYFSGLFMDSSYSRYVGYAVLLYFFFLTQDGKKNEIEIFTVGFIPFYVLTNFFMISNFSS
tara:strand:+ start:34669 stop:35655 length:987 start_codon:yes stop_codon:yes gene_type:complete